MPAYEYKVVPAPKRGLKAKGVKGTEARFAHALSEVMNEHGAEGWEYQRTDTLPCEERQGLTGKVTLFQNMLVFRRVLDAAQQDQEAADAPRLIEKLDQEPSGNGMIESYDASRVSQNPPDASDATDDEKRGLAAE